MNQAPLLENVSVESLLSEVADEFVERLGRGEQPAIEEYACRYPELATVLRQVLAALQVLRAPALGAAPPADPAAWPAPETGCLGDFRIVREIGRGGMGVVYEAVQVSLGRHVALKVLPVEAARDAKVLARFRRESQAAAQLHHSNIVPVFEVGQQGDVCFYAMQYIQGQPLDAVIRELQRLRSASEGTPCPDAAPVASAVAQSLLAGRFEPARTVDATLDYKPEVSGESQPTAGQAAETPAPAALSLVASDQRLYCRQVARLGLQVAEALAYAHSRGIVHRDIKPSNLLLDTAGIVWVSDFGLAKTQEQALTETGDLVGTVRYMAPERFQGVCDARADVYALGLTLYELLLLRPAFDGPDRLRLIDQIGHQEPARPRLLDARIPRDLETILMKAIEKEPRRRYTSAEAMAEDLRRFLADEPIRARRIGPLERLGRWGRRNPLVAGLSAAVVLVTALGFIGVLGQWQVALANEQRANANAAEAQKKEREATQQRDEVRALNDRLQRTLYAAHMNLAQQAWEAGGPQRVRELLEQHRPKPGESNRRGFEWYYLYRLCHTDLLTIAPGPGLGSNVAFSPDGKRLVSGGYSQDRTVRLWDAQTGQEILSLKGAGWHVAFSPDGKRLVGDGAGGVVKVWDAQTGQELLSLKAPSGGSDCWVAFSPDGKHLAATYNNWVAGKQWPDGGNVKVWDAQTGQGLRVLHVPSSGVWSMAFSPDGKRLASSDDKTVKVWDVQTGQELLTCKGHTPRVWSVAFSPDGRRLASSCGDGTVQVWDAQTGQEILSIKGAGGSVVFSPDGKRLATGQSNGWVKVWDAQTGQDLLTLKGHNGGITSVVFRPDGKRLASASTDGTVKVWDAQTRPNPLPLRGAAASSAASVAFSPDGKHLATGGEGRPGSGPGAVTVWDAQTGQEIRTLQGHTARVTTVAYSPDGQRLASGAGQDRLTPGEVKVWDAQTGQELLSLQGRGVRGVAFSPDGKRLASASDDTTVKVWDAQTGRELLTLKKVHPSHGANTVAFSPDGKHLASGAGWPGMPGEVKLWDAQTGQELFSLQGPYRVAFSPDGKRLASAGGYRDGTVKVWDAQTGQELLTCKGHIKQASTVVFSRDGTRLVSTGSEGLKVWDAQTGQELLTMKGGTAPVEFSPDGHRLVCVVRDQPLTEDKAGDGILTIWDATPLPEKP